MASLGGYNDKKDTPPGQIGVRRYLIYIIYVDNTYNYYNDLK